MKKPTLEKIALAFAVGWIGYSIQKKYGCAVAFAFMGGGLVLLTELNSKIDGIEI